MYFSFFKLKKWGKKTAETRRRNCAVLPYGNWASSPVRAGGGKRIPELPAVTRTENAPHSSSSLQIRA